MQARRTVIGAVLVLALGAASPARAASNPPVPYNLPPPLDEISQWVSLESGVLGTFQGIEWAINLFESGGPSSTTLLQAIQKTDTDVLTLTSNVESEFTGTDYEIKYQDEANKLASLETVVENLLPSPSLPPDQIQSAADMHTTLEDIANYLSKATAYQRGNVTGADDGTVSAAGPIPNSTLTSYGGVPWKSIIADRSAIGSGSQVYDWRVGVPFLLEATSLELIAMSQLDPAFNTNTAYQDILTSLLHGLQWNLAMMLDGVRCGTSSIAPMSKLYVGCADIYTGTNQTYSVQDPAWGSYQGGQGRDPDQLFMLSCYVNQSISPALSMPGSSCNCLDPNVTSAPPTYYDVPANWWPSFYAKRVIPTYIPGENAACDAQFDTYAIHPAATAARNAVLAQMPLAAMRSLIGILTQFLNPEPNQTAWTSCVNAYNLYGARSKPGDTTCNGASAVPLVPTFGGWSSIPLAQPFLFTSLAEVWNNPTTSWPQINGYSGAFVQQWAPVALTVPGDFTGDGRWDIALTGGPGWQSIPIAHALGDGSYAVTNGYVGSHSMDCVLGFSGSSQCSHLGVDFAGRGFDFAAAAATPNVQTVSGDFDGDGKTDIALVGGAGWTSIPVAFSDGGGSFLNVTHYEVAFSGGGIAAPAFPDLAAQTGTKAVAGDFDGDGRGDVALVNSAWSSVPVAFSNGDGTFNVVNTSMGSDVNFETYVGWAEGRVLGGDFDGDGLYDIAAVGGGGPGIAIAFSNGDGTFTAIPNVPMDPAVDMSLLAQSPIVGGDFNGDGYFDIGEGNIYGGFVELLSQGRAAGFSLQNWNPYYTDPNTSGNDFTNWWNSSSPVRAVGAF